MKILIFTFLLISLLFMNGFCEESAELNSNNFQKEVLESDKLIIIDFWAEWCHSCKILNPIIERLIEFNQRYNRDKIKWFKVNVDKNKKFLNNFRPLRGLPVIVFYKNGKEVDRIMGLLPFLTIQDRINLLLKEVKKKNREDKGNLCEGCLPPEN